MNTYEIRNAIDRLYGLTPEQALHLLCAIRGGLERSIGGYRYAELSKEIDILCAFILDEYCAEEPTLEDLPRIGLEKKQDEALAVALGK